MVKFNFNKQDNPTEWAGDMVIWATDVDKAVEILRENFPIRRIDETLSRAIEKRANNLNITADEVRLTLQRELGTQNVNHWLTPGRVKSIKRDKAIMIAFVLQMTYEETEELLKKFWLDGFHMRNVKDVIFRYGLENIWTYNEAATMIQKMELIFPNITGINKNPSGNENTGFTQYLKEQYEKGEMSKEEFDEFIRQNEEKFGSYRRTAYEWFKEYYDELSEEWGKQYEEDYNLDSISGDTHSYERKTVSEAELCDVIVKGIPKISSNETLDENLRTFITRSIPGSASIRSAMSEIINQYQRRGNIAQVDRGLLLLAYLASKDSVLHDKKEWEKEQDKDKKLEKQLDCFKDHIEVINFDLLVPCGMATLDARHPFDWIIMNSLRRAYYANDEYAVDDLQDLIDRMRNDEKDDF